MGAVAPFTAMVHGENMMKKSSLASFCLVLGLGALTPAHASDEADLLQLMGKLQYMTHKANLAVEAQNKPLANFYVHEIEEVIKELEAIESFDGHPVGALAKTVLVPAFEALEDSVKAADWVAANAKFDDLVASCNSCHKTTDHAYIHIKRISENPYMQVFSD